MSEVYAVHINDRDSCVTVTEAVKAGDMAQAGSLVQSCWYNWQFTSQEKGEF